MSSPAVRSQFRAAWAVTGVPLVETLNENPSDVEIDVPVWATVMFTADTSQHQTMGSSPWIEEQGTITIMIHSYSGVTDSVVAAAAGEVKNFWDMWISDTKDTWVTSTVGPRPPDPDAQGDYYRLAVDLSYSHQYRGG